jgi:hypothetical protein
MPSEACKRWRARWPPSGPVFLGEPEQYDSGAGRSAQSYCSGASKLDGFGTGQKSALHVRFVLAISFSLSVFSSIGFSLSTMDLHLLSFFSFRWLTSVLQRNISLGEISGEAKTTN